MSLFESGFAGMADTSIVITRCLDIRIGRRVH